MNNILDVFNKVQCEAVSADFIGKGNIWINNTYDESVYSLAKYITTEALKNTAPGQLSIVGYDSDLSGIFAPFASLLSGETKSFKLISDKKEFEDYLDIIWQQIQSVQNVIQGRSHSLLEFRQTSGRPVESYHLIVLSLDMGLLDNQTRAKLALLMKKGPSNGVSFLVVSTTLMTISTKSGHDIELSVEAIAKNITVLETDGRYVVNTQTKQSAQMPKITAETIINECMIFSEKAKTAQLPVVRYDELHDMNKFWMESSIDGLTFSVGMYGVNRMDITIGDEINQKHNLIITGAVGQGKSNLISVIIHSLCHNYSPRELQLYLLDFKEGVTFKAFSDIGQEEYLPHAKALGLECDSDFGFAVLSALYKEYQRRMGILKEYRLKSIRELRLRNPDIVFPRIVTVIDEFQLMFDNTLTSQKTADLLEKSVRLFRAAGIHFILASQTLSDTGNYILSTKKDSLFGQIPIRIALKNTDTESRQTLGLNNPAACYLLPREAIVNIDYGNIVQNRKTVIAFADEALLKPLRKTWWMNAREAYPAPYVFESEKRVDIRTNLNYIRKSTEAKKIPYAYLGAKISVDGDLIAIPMSRESGRNIAIIGTPDTDCNNAYGIMQGIAISLALQSTDGQEKFVFCDFNSDTQSYEKQFPEFVSFMQKLGNPIEVLTVGEFREYLDSAQKELTGSEKVYLFGSCLDKWEYERDPYGQGSPLKIFVETAPGRDIHFVGWWQKASSFNAQVSGFSNSDAFNTKVFLRVDERTVQSLTGPSVRWTAQTNRALISDPVEFSEEMAFVPYAPFK